MLFFRDQQFQYFSAETYAAVILANIQNYHPWLVLMGHTSTGKELAPRLAAKLNTGLVTNCVRIDLANPQCPKFYRPVYGGQLYQEIILDTGRPMLITMNPEVLNIRAAAAATTVATLIIEPKLAVGTLKTIHQAYLPADLQKADIAEAKTVVSAGMGAATGEILPMVAELAMLVQGAIGTTRPVVDKGKIPRERMIGQTGKIVSPDFYLALGISGASPPYRRHPGVG